MKTLVVYQHVNYYISLLDEGTKMHPFVGMTQLGKEGLYCKRVIYKAYSDLLWRMRWIKFRHLLIWSKTILIAFAKFSKLILDVTE
jgi:hypothetical protein